MEALQTTLSVIGLAVPTVLLAGLAARRLYRVCYTFAAYVVAVTVFAAVIRFWPERFFQIDFYLFKEGAYGLLKLAMAIEIARRTFGAFPAAAARARTVLRAALIVLSLWMAPVLINSDVRGLAQEALPRLANGTALLMAAVWALLLWFNLPLHPLHRAILRGLVPYLLLFTLLFSLLTRWGWTLRAWVSVLDSAAYDGLLVYWSWVAWRVPPRPPADPELVRRLQPWRN